MRIYNNENVNLEIIGGFYINETGKEYVVCSYDNLQSENVTIIILQVEVMNGEKQFIGIPPEEKEFVVNYYNFIKKQLLKEEKTVE